MFKKLTYIICFFLSISAYCQEYKNFKVNLALGAAIINRVGGPAFSFEPAYRINDRCSFGFKLEGIGIFGGTNTPSFIGSKSINTQYYFFSRVLRPFIGAGVGIYNMNDGIFIGDGGYNYEKNKIGFYPRIGFDYNHLTIIAEYNLMTPVKSATQGDLITAPVVSFISANYLSIKLGLSIGGGKKK